MHELKEGTKKINLSNFITEKKSALQTTLVQNIKKTVFISYLCGLLTPIFLIILLFFLGMRIEKVPDTSTNPSEFQAIQEQTITTSAEES